MRIKIDYDTWGAMAILTESVTCGAPADHYGFGGSESVAVLKAWDALTQWKRHQIYMAAWR